MIASPVKLTLNSAEETTQFAARLGALLSPRDVLLLDGSIGSGKTHFARSLIQSRMAEPEDVPSPTFTLVQVYDTDLGEIWHTDLYRIGSLDEVEELGLTEALDTAICLIEWPGKLGPLTPVNALSLSFSLDPDREGIRHLTLAWSAPKWAPLLENAL